MELKPHECEIFEELTEQEEIHLRKIWEKKEPTETSWFLKASSWLLNPLEFAGLVWCASYDGPSFVYNILFTWWWGWNLFAIFSMFAIRFSLGILEKTKSKAGIGDNLLSRNTFRIFKKKGVRRIWSKVTNLVVIGTLYGYGWWATAFLLTLSTAYGWLFESSLKEKLLDSLRSQVKRSENDKNSA